MSDCRPSRVRSSGPSRTTWRAPLTPRTATGPAIAALWAIRTAGDRELSHPEWQRIKETHEVWKNAWFGVEFGRMTKTAGRRQPIEDVEIEWVEDAIRVANLVGSAIGWEHARWDQLLAELIAMEPEVAPAHDS